MFKFKKIILFVFFIKLTNAFIYPQQFKNVSIENIQEKETFYKELFDTNKKIKKAAFVTIGTSIAIFLSYQGFQLWKNLYSVKSDNHQEANTESTEPINTTNKQTTKNKGFSDNLIKTFNHGIKKGIKKAGTMVVSLTILYIISDLLKPLKDEIINFFKLNDKQHFNKIKQILNINLMRLREIFLLESPMCIIDEISDHYNFFLENAENLLAFTSAIANKRVHSLTNYESIKNQQNIMYKNIHTFSEKLTQTFSNTQEKFLNKDLAYEIIDDFRTMNNQIFRFINFLEAVLYEV